MSNDIQAAPRPFDRMSWHSETVGRIAEIPIPQLSSVGEGGPEMLPGWNDSCQKIGRGDELFWGLAAAQIYS